MKTKQVLFSIVFILFVMGWYAPVWAQDIPTNYIQNPNMEHELNAIFWYGDWSPLYGMNGIVTHPDDYMSNLESHSGNWSMDILPGCWIWVSYPVRGHEEKKFKASFWYKGYMTGYWNFIYRDVGMTEEDLPPDLAEYVGADTCYHEFGGQDALRFEMWGDDTVARDGWTEDWTYFEFVWDFPGTIPGSINTSMWYGANAPAYLDDLYYGEWYDGQYMGEEPFGFINGDFEKEELNGEWLINLLSWDAIRPNDFISWTENHTDAGLQSLGLSDYKEIWIDTADVVLPYDSISIDTSDADRNITYYLPALGAEDEDMEISFWYKGNAATLDLNFYDNYGVTPDEFPLPAGSVLVEDVENTIYDIVTVIKFDDESTIPVGVLGTQNFDDANNLAMPGSAWCWSGEPYYDYNDWAGATTDAESHSGSSAHWLPGDPNWTGAEGTFDGIIDDTTYVISFWYKGKGLFDLYMGSSFKYDLVGDPDGVVPATGATADKDKIHWDLDAADWTQFTYIYTQGSWLADSSVTSPAKLRFQFVGAADSGDVAYIDDVFAGIIDEFGKPDGSEFAVVPDTLSVTVPPFAARWELPAVDVWTKQTISWTNPSGNIGGNLTMFLNNDMTGTPAYIDPSALEFDPENPGWTYLDDFEYQVVTGINNRSAMQKDLHVYPNPAVDDLYLSLEIPLRKVEMYNSTGQKVRVLMNPDRKLNVSDLPSGMYLLHAYDEQGTVHVAKFIRK
jgi:hypothetical protein